MSSWKRLVEKYDFMRGLELWNKLLCRPFVVTRQVQLTRFLPTYSLKKEKSFQARVLREDVRLICLTFETAMIGDRRIIYRKENL